MLRLNALTKVYSGGHKPAIEDVSFDVRDGEIVGFVGLNGAGKTTTIRISGGLTLPTTGNVFVDGHDIVKNKSEASSSIGFVPEFPYFEQSWAAEDLLVYFGSFYGMSKHEVLERATELFQEVNLLGYERKKLRTYSQGMKKRFSLTAALLSDPKNLLLDEILNGLDAEGIHFFRSLIIELRKKGKAVLLSSHNLAEIENVSDRIVFIHRGKIVKIVTKQELAQLERASGSLKMIIENLGDDVFEYLRTLGEVKSDGNTIWLSNFEVDPPQISNELMKRGFLLREFHLERPSLEEYFLELIEMVPIDARADLTVGRGPRK
ncbi:MAG: ABC transporter ATP-binding protein [Thaumarchaeota archaeon]|nr:ABC transporter ATP-binding protein [Nitrososphaerota archaeon]